MRGGLKMSYQKRFPADTSLEDLTFLNDKNIDAELYAFLQGLSLGVQTTDGHKTVVYKKDMPTQSKICARLGIKSPKTYRTHLSYLMNKGYVVESDEGYELPEMEHIFFFMPLKTVQYLMDNCKDHVVKIYIYLGQRYKYAMAQGKMYEFTLEELGEHIGLKIKNNSRGYEIINNALELLYNSGLIDYCEYFNGKSQKKKLTAFSFEYSQKDG